MHLSTLSLTILTFAASADAWKAREGGAAASAARRRILQKNEARLLAADPRLLKNPNANGNNAGGNGGNPNNGGTTDTDAVGGSTSDGSRGNGGGGGNPGNGGGGGGGGGRGNNNARGSRGGLPAEHSAQLDPINTGITADAIEYVYGDAVSLTFELTNDFVSEEVRANLDVANMDQWSVAVYMRMAAPQCGALDPIATVKPTITANGGRRLQQDQDQDGDTTVTTSTEAPMPGTQTVASLDHDGVATFTATDATTLDINTLGSGFDFFVIDENGCAIVGPATIYMKPTAAMAEADAAATNAKKNQPKKGLAKFNHASKTKGKSYGSGGTAAGGAKVQGGNPSDKGKGLGSDGRGGVVISTGVVQMAELDYTLHTDALYYDYGDDTVTVTYDITGAGSTVRRLQGKNGNSGNGGGNNGNNGNNNQATTTDPTQGASTTDAATTDAATTTTPTTTTELFDPDMGDGSDPDTADAQPTVDTTDVTLFSMGVYMRMSHPQDGALDPVFSLPFCADPANCASAEELASGTFAFNTNELDIDAHGLGYDVWILNGAGGGHAGPYTFYINEPASS